MIRIVADTTCGLPLEQLNALQIPVLPQMIIFGDECYRDDTEIDTPTFLKKLRAASVLPKTAAPAPALYTPIYTEFMAQHDTIIVITPSSEVSGTMRSAHVAAKDFPDADIRVVDTRTVAGGLGSIVLKANEWAKEGIDPDTLVNRIERMAQSERLYFVVDTLEYLFKGGRIGGAKALFGSLLQLKPILTLKDGHIEPVETQRTKRRAIARVVDLVVQECPCTDEAHLTVSHCGAEEEAQEIAETMRKALQLQVVPIYQVPPAIVVHGGPKIIEVSFFRNTTPVV